ncbi:MAG: translesion error-prone DNA polymerase V autoproteolytic subunit [Pseudohongiella sp.]|nr:translesion error-prone DNA polymerase V autoproteolytic subunit [Pseudohongiella sp.]
MIANFIGCSTHVPARLRIPFFLERVRAGFPSPAQDYVEKTLDLNELCIKHPAATFFVRVEGDSMIGEGILSGDVLVVDRSLTAKHDDVVVASVDGEFTVKILATRPRLALLPANSVFKAIEFAEGDQLEIFGVVTSVVRSLQRKS